MSEFRVWCPERGGSEEDATVVKARSASDAAEEWADREDWEANDYLIVRQDWAPIVCVRDGAKVRTFRVTGESQRVYTAREQEAL